MKKSRKCPKCNSTDIVRIDGSVEGYGAGNNLKLGATIFSAVKVNRYVCCTCGFIEEWLDKEDIEKVKNSKKAKRYE